MNVQKIVVVFALPYEASKFRTNRTDVEVWVLDSYGKAAVEKFRDRLDAQATPPAQIVSAGFAGALDPSLPAGATFIVGDTPAYGLPARHLETIDYIAGHEEKRKIFETTGAAACDMETAYIAEICAQRNIPFFGVRVVSDAADTPVPVELFVALLENKMPSWKPLRILLSRPSSWSPFIRLVRECSLARTSLTRALDKIFR